MNQADVLVRISRLVELVSCVLYFDICEAAVCAVLCFTQCSVVVGFTFVSE